MADKLAVDHTRYLALGCREKHNTSFFDDCCHPLLATESFSDRPSYCTPNVTESSSASVYTATASTTASADAEASTEFSEATASVQSVYSSVAAVESSSSVAATETSSSVATETSSTIANETSSTIANAVNAYAHHRTTSTSTYEALTTTSSQPAATSTSSGSSGDVMTGGFATYFTQDGRAGECGQSHSDSDKVIAIATNGWWSDYEYSSSSPYCGKYITLTNTNNGKSVTAMVADACPSCEAKNSLDLSLGAFAEIATEVDGMVPITWVWA